jgi:hypothetical protein
MIFKSAFGELNIDLLLTEHKLMNIMICINPIAGGFALDCDMMVKILMKHGEYQ